MFIDQNLQNDKRLQAIIRFPTWKMNTKEQQRSVQFSCSVVSDSLPPHGLQHISFPVITNSWNLLKIMSIEAAVPPNHLIFCHPLLLPL